MIKNKTIGMEVHVELKTKSKMFCSCSSNHFSAVPNSKVCPVCLGLPGALPVPNRKAIEWAQLIGLALNCRINSFSRFDRKHYFYPDLPKGYQITQYEYPFCEEGYIMTSEGKVRIKRVHLEEDTGKLKHETVNGKKMSLVDFNRSGVPLVEIVTYPDIHSPTQAKEYTKELQTIIRSLKVSDCDMEKGSMRLEANISWGLNLGYKVEVKNLNSHRFIEKAIEYELDRQKNIMDSGKIPMQETRGWDENSSKTVGQRSKEEAEDYRYFPEPDIPPFSFKGSYIKSLHKKLPKLPDQIAKELVKIYKIRNSYAQILSINDKLLDLAYSLFQLASKSNLSNDQVANFIINKGDSVFKSKPEDIIESLVGNIQSKITDLDTLNKLIDSVIQKNQKLSDDIKKGKTEAISVIIGIIMKDTAGKADPILTRNLIEKKFKMSK